MKDCNPFAKEKIKVMLVDENPEFFEIVKDQIELHSHQFDIACRHIEEVANAAEALSSWRPNLVVLDYSNSPLMAAKLVKDCHHCEVPLIITGEIMNKEVEEAVQRIGALAYIVKSEDPDELEKVIELFAAAAKETAPVH
jgi:DNA-binding NtrC family response regulator